MAKAPKPQNIQRLGFKSALGQAHVNRGYLKAFVKGEKYVKELFKEMTSTDTIRTLHTAMMKAGRIVRDEARKQVPGKWKKIKKDIRARSKKPRGEDGGPKSLKIIKVGWQVGRSRDETKEKPRGKGRGVGISGNNIHWFVLGTDLRFTGFYRGRRTSGPVRYTGRINEGWGANLRPIFKKAGRKSKRRVIRVIKTTAKERLKELQKKKRRKRR